MIALTAPFPVVALIVGLSQAPQRARELPELASRGPDSALVAHVRRLPDEAREKLRGLLSTAARGDSGAESSLRAAERLAAAYASAWRDPFLVRRVARFRELSPARRKVSVAAESLRVAGNAVLGSRGIAAAERAWRESLRRFELLSDTAGMAAAIGNLGAGFYLEQQHDSAEAYLSQSLQMAESAGDWRTAGNALGMLANVSKDRGDLRKANDLYTRAGELRERVGDERGLAADRQNLGLIAQELGDLAAARHAFDAALGANRRAGRNADAATNLVNLGNVSSEQGDYEDAGRRYREALAIYRELGSTADAAFVLHNLGGLAMRRGDYSAAVTALASAAVMYRRTGPAVDEIAVRRDLAVARAAAGHLQAARAELQRAESLATRTPGDVPANLLATLALARGDLAIEFNRLAEAERQYARAERLARAVGDHGTRAAAQQGLGIVLLIRESHPRAQAALELALRTQEGTSDRRAAATTRTLLGYVHRQRGDTALARRVLGQALDTLRAIGDVAGEARVLGAIADLEMQAGLPLTAESLYTHGLVKLGPRAAPGVAWTLHAGLGRALRSHGALNEAARRFRLAIDQIERMSGGLTAEERRAAFWTDKWEVYVELALIERANGRPHAAFFAAGQLKARQMLDMLARGRITPAGQTASSVANLEQDLRRRIAELTRQVEAAPDTEERMRGSAPAGEDRGTRLEALGRAQEAYGELLVRMREDDPVYEALVRATPATAHDVSSALAPDEALLEYVVGDSTTIVFVVTSDSVVALDLNVTHSALAALVDFARATLGSSRHGAAGHRWRAPLQRLYAQLIGPIESRGLLEGRRRLLIAPHAELHYLPFAALVTPGAAGEPLMQRYVIGYVPSASVWLRLRGRPQVASPESVLAMAPRATALPGSLAEVAAIGRIYRERARVLTGPTATERAFRTLVPGRRIVHLATYGVLNKHNPLFSFVQLGAGDGEDGRLEVHEVFGLKLDAQLLVLSACQTGLAAGALADVPPGDDWIGLVRAFLFAGASNVMATLWPVEDRSTARLMERFYVELAAGRAEDEALAVAQRAAAADPATAHPFFWAGPVMVRGR